MPAPVGATVCGLCFGHGSLRLEPLADVDCIGGVCRQLSDFGVISVLSDFGVMPVRRNLAPILSRRGLVAVASCRDVCLVQYYRIYRGFRRRRDSGLVVATPVRAPHRPGQRRSSER